MTASHLKCRPVGFSTNNLRQRVDKTLDVALVIIKVRSDAYSAIPSTHDNVRIFKLLIDLVRVASVAVSNADYGRFLAVATRADDVVVLTAQAVAQLIGKRVEMAFDLFEAGIDDEFEALLEAVK